MVAPTTRWTATPLLLLLLSSIAQAQYTLRGRVVQDHHTHSLSRRAEPAARHDPASSDKPAAGGDGGNDAAGPEVTESTKADKGEGDHAPASGNKDEDGGDDVKSDDKASTGGRDGGGGSNALYLVSHEDFCVYGPSEKGTPIASAGDNVVSWCRKDHGSKTIPEGTLTGVTYVKTPNYVQVSGSGDFSKINISPDDLGGQLDSSKHTPSGAQLLLGADKSPVTSWVTIIGHDTFCVRACTGDPQYCPTQYDELGCYFLTQNGVGWPDQFQDCEGEDGDVPGVHNGETYTQGQGPMPSATAPAVSNCNGGGPPGGVAAGPTSSDHKSGANGTSAAHSTGSGSSSSSEQWLPVETCVPCAGAGSGSGGSTDTGSNSTSGKPPATSSTSATPALSGTSEVGVSQLATGGSLSAGGASALAGSLTTAPKPGGDALVQKRQEKSVGGGEADKAAGGEGDKGVEGDKGGEGGQGGEGEGDGAGEEEGASSSEGGDVKTTTRGDQCCFTTWTQAAGGAKPTSTGAGAGAGKAGASTSAPFGGMSNPASPSASKGLNGTAAGGVNKTTGGINGTGNGTGNGTDSGAGSRRGQAFGVDGMGKIVGGLIIGLVSGGWLLV